MSDIPSFVVWISTQSLTTKLTARARRDCYMYIQGQSSDNFLSKADHEIYIDIRRSMRLAVWFFPHLRKEQAERHSHDQCA